MKKKEESGKESKNCVFLYCGLGKALTVITLAIVLLYRFLSALRPFPSLFLLSPLYCPPPQPFDRTPVRVIGQLHRARTLKL